jgi:hypothetical protein
MLDILRNLTRTASEKRQEQLNAYLDGELRGPAREHFEAQLAADPALRAETAQLRAIKEQVGQLPRLRAPRNYTLDPARYGAPAPARGLALYPALRVATVLTAFFFMLAFGLDFVARPQQPMMAPAEDSIALFEAPAEEAAVERMEVPQEPLPEPEREAGRAVAEEIAVEGEAAADVADSAAMTLTEIITEVHDEAMALPAPGAEEVEEAVGAALPEEALLPALASPPPPVAEPITVEDSATAPALEHGTGEPVVPPLRVAQVVLGIALIVLLVTTLLLRRHLI